MGIFGAAIAAFPIRRAAHEKTMREPVPPAKSVEPTIAPLSTNAEALGEYRAGLQAARDAGLNAALRHFERATELDPWFAAAHLRYVANMSPAAHDPIVKHYQSAWRSRSTLDEHDRILLDAYEPIARDTADARDAARRIEGALHDRPGDSDFLLSLCRLRFFAGAYREAVDACDQAASADGSLAIAYMLKGVSLVFADDPVAAREAYAECLRISPAGTLCIGDRINLELNEGLCEDAILDARRLIALEPETPEGYWYLANALAGNGASREASELALQQRWPRIAPGERAAGEAQDSGDMAIFTGDLDAARRWLEQRDAALLSVRVESEHLAVLRERAMLALETGRLTEASSLADAFLSRRVAGWSTAQGLDSSIVAWGIRYRAGTTSKADFAANRARWLASERAKPTFGEVGSSGGLLWVMAYAEPSITEADAFEALRELPHYLPLPDAYTRSPDLDEPIGRVYLRAHALTEASRYLGRAARACTPVFFPLFQTTASLEFAEAEALLGDTRFACEAYATVISRWGSMLGSTSARAARKEAARLKCRL